MVRKWWKSYKPQWSTWWPTVGAILIIALALGVLYSLGVLNPSRLKPVMCILPAPFNCQIQTFDTAGNLTITLSQGSGQTITINRIACIENSLLNSTGLPAADNYWSPDPLLVLPPPKLKYYNVPIASGGSYNFVVACYIRNNSNPANANASKYSGPISSTFAGTLVINYSIGNTMAPPFYFTVGTITTQVNTPYP